MPESATFTDALGLYFYDTGKFLSGIKVRTPFLVVRFRVETPTVGPWHQKDFTVVDCSRTERHATYVDVGGKQLFWVDSRANPVISFEKVTFAKSGKRVVAVAFKDVDPRSKSVTVKYKGKEMTVSVLTK